MYVVLPSYIPFVHNENIPQVTIAPSAWSPELSFRHDGFKMVMRYLSRDVYDLGFEVVWAKDLHWPYQQMHGNQSLEIGELTQVWVLMEKKSTV